jgi:hypothetical protein
LFRRRRTEEPEQSPDGDHAAADHAADDHAADGDPVTAADLEQNDEGGTEDPDGSGPQFDRSRGPWDVSEVASTDGYVDLGGLRLPGRDGMELRLEIDEATDRVTSATVQLEGSAVQLQVFAAPRTEGIWDEIRTEIAAGVTRQGGTADEVPGVFGRELIARIPVRTPDGRTGHQPARFAGVDGPRWFLRAVFHGVAVHEPERAGPVEDVVRDAVVVRGPEAMAPRELLTLRLPDQHPDQHAATAEPAADSADSGEFRDPLQPFTRGPEITEIR